MEQRMVQEINAQHTRRKRWHRIWSVLATLAAFYTTYVLILPAITMSRQLVCGKPEHTHTEACFRLEQVLTCGLPETEDHVHSESCYALENVTVCAVEEHAHSEFCYDVGPADANADVETQEDWERSISRIELSGHREEDVAAVAMTQLGYRESSRNYITVDELSLNGYTRYGAWYGNPYGDWDAMFASFVLHYAGVDDFGRAEDPKAWAQKIAQKFPQRYQTADGYTPGKGDLVFFDRDLDGEIDGVGILAEVSEDVWRVMEGNAEDAVSLINYAPGDNRVAAYGLIEALEASGEKETVHTITYVANNGTEETVQKQVRGEVTVSCDGFASPKGMTLSGWNTALDGSGIDCADGTKLVLTEDMTFYAQWTQANTNSNDTPPNPVSSTGSIALAKQIEWTGTNEDDYRYRLHLTLDGSTLSSGSVTTVTPSKKRHIGILLDVTETMTATSDWSSGGENKFDAVRSLLQGDEGFLDSILDGSTYVSIILVGGQSGYGTYEQLSKEIAAGDSLGDFSNIDNSLHLAQGISYVTGLKAAEKYLENDIDSLVYIVGNETDTYVKYSDGTLERGTNGTQAQNKNYNDYVTFMGNHPDLSMYMVGVAPVERGSKIAQQMGDFSVSRGTGGGYFEANNKDALKDHLENIAQQIVVPPDKVKNISVTDTLSANVSLPKDYNLTAELKELNSDGTVKSTTDVSAKVTVKNGVLTCDYPDEIKGPFKLEIAFDIQTADGVYQHYTDTGDAKTDWGTNTTSSGKAGFFSNGSATASYTLNNVASTGLPFPKPVVQAPQKATITLTKQWVGAGEADKKSVTVELHRGAKDGKLVSTAELNADNGWTASCDVKICTAGDSNEIFVVEQAVDGFTASYNVASVSVKANETYSITVTNTREAKTAQLTVKKHWKNVSGMQQARIHVCVKDGVNYAEIDGSPFTVNNGADGAKTFPITWTGETSPVIYIYEERSDGFYPVITGDGTAKTVTIADQQLSAMELTVQADENYTVTLTNMASVQMPDTGGSGTQGYVLGGLVLVFSAVLLMQIRRIKPKGGQPSQPSG